MSKDYEKALVDVWQKLGGFCTADISRLKNGKRIEEAYYAAENALYKAGHLKIIEGELRLADQVTGVQSDNSNARHG